MIAPDKGLGYEVWKTNTGWAYRTDSGLAFGTNFPSQEDAEIAAKRAVAAEDAWVVRNGLLDS